MNRLGTTVSAMMLMLSLGGAALAQENSSRQTIPLVPADILASEMFARMAFICGATSDPSRLTVTVRRATPGAMLTLSVGGIPRATAPASSGGTVRFAFTTGTVSGTRRPLDFDPRDREVEIEDGGGTLLTNTTPEGGNPPGSRLRERAVLTPTGAIAGASGRVRLRERRGVRDFDVEIEDVPDGDYTLMVDGTSRGTITVAGGEGKIEFSDGGDDPDELPLDFDPLAALVQVAQGSTIILSGRLLADSPGVSVCTPSESTTELSSSGADPDANGEARIRTKDDCDRDFRVEIEDLPIGTYEVVVGGILRGTIDVADLGLGETEGEIEFDTDADEAGEVLLDFDPVGQTLEIRQGATVFLSSAVGEPGPGTCDAVDDEPAMTNSGVDLDADGKARFRQETDCDRDFRVEVDDLAVGSYELVVGGVVRGTIEVADVGAGDTEGEIDFDSDPDDPGELLLDFDPRGELIEVRQGAIVFLTIEMPA